MVRRKGRTYGVIGMLDVFREPREDSPALPAPLGDGDAPFCPPLGDLPEFASRSFRN